MWKPSALPSLARAILRKAGTGSVNDIACWLINVIFSKSKEKYRGRDGKPPSRIVGVIENDFYVRAGYTADEVYECYCTALASSQCGSEQHWPSPEHAYISRTLAGDAARQRENEEGAAADVALSLGVTVPATCHTSRIGGCCVALPGTICICIAYCLLEHKLFFQVVTLLCM